MELPPSSKPMKTVFIISISGLEGIVFYTKIGTFTAAALLVIIY